MLKVLESYLINKLYPHKEGTVFSCGTLILIILGSISIFASKSFIFLYLLKYLNSTYALELSKSSQILIFGVFYLLEALVIFIIFKIFCKKKEVKSEDMVSRSVSAFLDGYKKGDK